MKKNLIIFATGLTLFTNTVFAQDFSESQVPKTVIDHFHKDFPFAQDVKWEKELGHFIAEFETGLVTNNEAWYNDQGILLRHRERLTQQKLPQKINTQLEVKYKEYNIGDVDRITTGPVTIFAVKLKKYYDDKEVTFNHHGEILKEVLF